jgi:hypothetical protein
MKALIHIIITLSLFAALFVGGNALYDALVAEEYVSYESIMDQQDIDPTATRNPGQQAGTIFMPYDPAGTATLTGIGTSWLPGANSIWGATGRDDQGHIWLGVSGTGDTPAHLYEFDPGSGSFSDHGDPVSALKDSGLYRQGEHQAKLHSKIVPMDDGWLYFASMDESGENADEGRLPTWGSHLWRYLPSAQQWEHLFAAPEGLIAVSGAGRWVYALGYWDHILYQYDTHTGETSRVRVGSASGHISRNLIADSNGHVYVPRVSYFELPITDGQSAESEPLLVVTLIEYDQYLNEVQGTPLIHYTGEHSPMDSHGITSLSYLADGSIVFGTHIGYLYKITPSKTDAASVTKLGWLHPDGEAYNPVLVPLDGIRHVAGITNRRGNGYQLFVYDIEQQTSRPVALNFPNYPNLILYGSNTRDDQGRGYIVGRREGNQPVIFQLEL